MDPSEAKTPEQLFIIALWNEYRAQTERHPGGPFLRMPDDNGRAKCLIVAIASYITPMILEIETLRDRVDELEELHRGAGGLGHAG